MKGNPTSKQGATSLKAEVFPDFDQPKSVVYFEKSVAMPTASILFNVNIVR